PIINEAGYEKIAAQITDAVEKGAEVLTGNKYNVDKDKGYYFVYPTVLNDVNENMDIMHEETFGPVAPITTFKNLDEAVDLANCIHYGLAAYIFTNDYIVGS